jgi:hypothetical protein
MFTPAAPAYIHYMPEDNAASDQSRLGLVLAKPPPAERTIVAPFKGIRRGDGHASPYQILIRFLQRYPERRLSIVQPACLTSSITSSGDNKDWTFHRGADSRVAIAP